MKKAISIIVLLIVVLVGAGCTSSSTEREAGVLPEPHQTLNDVIDEQAEGEFNLFEGEGSFADLSFSLPEGWSVERIAEIDALNLYATEGEGTALDRSQMLIRYFDASDFLTLSTVTIHSREDLTVGQGDYIARRYDIEKKSGVSDFANQPAWRNERHIVTDFRLKDGYTRYYVVAARPDLEKDLYDLILKSILIAE